MAVLEGSSRTAVVIGGSMGGLLAARVLSEAFDRVTVVERDELAPQTRMGRKGVPQGRHGHALHPRGRNVLDELFPGFTEEVAADGAPLQSSAALRAVLDGHELARADMGEPVLSTTRPFLEGHVRRRVGLLENVTILDGCDVTVPRTADGGRRIVGVRVEDRRREATSDICADLVVDATGRGGRALRWLDDLGFDRPDEDELHVGVGYATRRIRLRTPAPGDDRMVLVGAEPGRPTGMYLAQVEDGIWVLTVFGYEGHEPPRDAAGFDAFVDSVAPAPWVPALRDAESLTDVVTHRLPSNLRRRYERLRRFPEGFLVFGDAICSFNPIYGQGMTVATLQALALRRELRRRRFDARRFFRAAARPVGDAWDLATGSDLSLPEVQGERTAKVRILNAYVARLLAAAEGDAVVSQAFLRVVGMLDRPPSILRPAIAARVLLRTNWARPATTTAEAMGHAERDPLPRPVHTMR